MDKNKIVIALPKGRILEEFISVMQKIDLLPEEDFFDEKTRKLRFKTNHPNLDIIRVRSFDVATFVAFGAAQIGIIGRDVLMEFDSPEIYSPIDLKIARCRLSLAQPQSATLADFSTISHIKIATKYPEITRKFFASRGIQAECIKLNGAMELAPNLGICDAIVDLVSSGKTLKENALKEVEKISDISTYLIVNRTSYKTITPEITSWINKIQECV